MSCVTQLAFTVTLLVGSAALAQTAEQAPPQTCHKAEVNPVTGHVLCIDPLGAPAEPPPEASRPTCKDEEARGQWSFGPNCVPEPGGA
jgi:hypothetical protein